MSGARPYPPGFFDEWTGEQRNVFYAEEARRYRVTQTGNGAAAHAPAVFETKPEPQPNWTVSLICTSGIEPESFRGFGDTGWRAAKCTSSLGNQAPGRQPSP